MSQILNLHEYAGKFVQKPISIFDSVEIAQAIKSLNLPPAKLDIGKLTYEFHIEDQKHGNAMAFVSEKLGKGRKTVYLNNTSNVLLNTSFLWHFDKNFNV